MSTRLYLRLSPADRARLCEVLRWARNNGYHRKRGYRGRYGEGLAWIRHGDGTVTMVVVDAVALTAYRLGAPVDRVQLTVVLGRPLDEVLSVLAAVGILPAQFADTAAGALREHARHCAQLADDVVERRHDAWRFYAAGLHFAARAAHEAAARA